jgi:molecular chaperone GrpE
VASHKQSPRKEPDAPAGAKDLTPDTHPEVVFTQDSAAPVGDSVADQITKLQAEKQEMMNTLVRRQADFENFKKRVEKEKQQDRNRGVEIMIEQMLPVLDAFDRALAGPVSAENADYRKGFEMIRGQLWNALAKQGLERIDTSGKEFDPNLHHAIESVPNTEHDEGTVVGEMQPGYRFQGRVLRPAMVRVAAERSN